MSIKQDRTGTRTSEDLRRRLNVGEIVETGKKVDASVEQVQKLSNQVTNLSNQLTGLNNTVTNTRESYVSTNAQTFTEEQKERARDNIGAGNSSFSGSYNDLSNKPTIPTKTSELENDARFVTDSGSITPIKNIKETGTNLNDYINPGIYYFSADYTPTNIPVGVNGWLDVLSSEVGAIKQIWYRQGSINSNDFHTFVRTRNTLGAWSNWELLATEDDIYYKDGDTYETTAYYYLGSMLSSGAKRIYATIFTSKSLKKIKTITVNNYNISARKVTGGYLLSDTTPDTFDGICVAQVVGENAISIFWTSNVAFAETNNTPVGISLGDLSLTFNE